MKNNSANSINANCAGSWKCHYRKLTAFTSVAALVLGSVSFGTSAQVEPTKQEEPRMLEEILVSARRTEENLQSVPIAITAISAADINEKNIRSPLEIMYHTPSMSATPQFGSTFGIYTIRGLAEGTTTYFAEAPVGPTHIGAPIFDLESIQVLNGPQGTQFGRANTAGAILFTPTAPDMQAFGGSARVALGDYGRQEFTGVINLPIIDNELAVRLALNHTHLDGYVEQLGSGDDLNEVDNDSIRLTVRWSPGDGRFSNTSILSYYEANQTPGAYVLEAYNPNFPLYNLPEPNSPLAGPVGGAVFGKVCAVDVANGFSPSTDACINQRLGIAAQFKPAYEAELDRLAKGGDNAKRKTPGRAALPNLARWDIQEKAEQWSVVNTAEFDFGEIGPTSLGVKYIFGYDSNAGVSSFAVDGIGGLVQVGISLPGSSRFKYGTTANQLGNQINADIGDDSELYTNEIKLSGSVGNRLQWLVGGYYETLEVPSDLDGLRNAALVFGGITQPNLGWVVGFPFTDGGSVEQKAGFAQVIVDVGDLVPQIAGLELSGGYRYTRDDESIKVRSADLTLPSGQYLPGDKSTQGTDSDGDNWAFAVNASITDDWLLYVTNRKGYRPGRVNQLENADQLTGFQKVVDPETVEDWEIGSKYSFATNSVQGFLNVAAYHSDYSDIQRNLSGLTENGVVFYASNVASATLKGVEVQSTMVTGDWDISLVYSYLDSSFDSWIGTDPLNIIVPGDPGCLPQSTDTQCFIDLSDNAFPNAPENQASVTLGYNLPLDSSYGAVKASVTASYRDRSWLTPNSDRELEVYGKDKEDLLSQESYVRYDARIGWSNIFGSKFDGALFVLNASDEIYKNSALTLLKQLGMATAMYAPPRTWGVELTYRYGE